MASTSWSKGQHLHSRKQEEEETKERLRESSAKRMHNISVYIPLARTKVHGYTQLQGALGNVVHTLTAVRDFGKCSPYSDSHVPS